MESCTLCANHVGDYPTIDGDAVFCCHGCHAVHRILFAKNELANYKEHPLFLQAARSGLISNPALLEELRASKEGVAAEAKETIHLEIEEMWCPSCAEVIKLILLRERGVLKVVVDYCTDLAAIEFDQKWISKAQIFSIIAGLGYKPRDLLSQERRAISRPLLLRFGIAAFFSLNIMMFAYPIYATYFDYDPQGYGELFAWISFLFSLPVLTYSAWPIFRRFWSSLLVGIMGMEGLVVMGVSAAFLLSLRELFNGGIHVYFDSMSVIITFVLLGKIIESKAKFSAKESIIRLSRTLPRRGRIIRSDGSEEFVCIKEIKAGDLVVVLTGEKVVLDGVVVEGEGTCDESIMTGEAFPVEKKVDAPMLAGTILQQGKIIYRVVKTSEETALHKIVEMVEKEIGYKTAYVRLADTVVQWFVPVVVVFAALTGLLSYVLGAVSGNEAIVRSVSILLISCPCAIGIAAPLAESHLMQALAVLGVIVRNRGCLPSLGRETVFVFDKTGTITEGKFQVLSGLDRLDLSQLQILKALTSSSTHPISRAIAAAIDADPIKLNQIQEHIGLGIVGEGYWLGSQEIAKKYTSIHPEALSTDTTVFFGYIDYCLASITLGDKVREEAPSVVKALHPAKTLLLSGDSKYPVARVAKLCEFSQYQWGCTPLDKRSHIDTLRHNGEIVCMLGDGINDAPALTAAHVGISVVNASDLSIEVSDILLTTDNLEVVQKMREITQKGHKIIRQNLFWAFFYNAIGIVMASLGMLTPLYAAFAMVISSLMVLFNAKRV